MTTTTGMKINMRSQFSRLGGRPAAGTLTVLLAAGALAGCEVTNPGPVQDEFLDQAAAHDALVNGSGRMLSNALSLLGYTSALASREILPGGQTGAAGHDPQVQAGVLLPTLNTHWAQAQQARWIAEDAVRRFKQVPAGTVNPQALAQAYLWAGYSNKVLGENFCDAVFDGGQKQPNAKYFERAVQAFTDAIAAAPSTAAGTNIKNAAYAGRAASKVFLKDWTGAVADANQVPATFGTFTLARATEDVATGGNDIFYANANSPYRGYTIWKTWYEGYYDQTGDPRTGYAKNASFPLAQQQLSGYGPVPWEYQTKYKTGNDPHRLSSYREMQLIKAEAALVANDMNTAINLINSIRTTVRSDKGGATLAPVTAANITEAWTLLKRERGIELWLEARRLGDIRRWSENNTPGVLDWPAFENLTKPDGSAGGSLFKQNVPSKCFPISDNEIDTNPNF
jgi:starch-binding outer membrane protein, SusD/RagB family